MPRSTPDRCHVAGTLLFAARRIRAFAANRSGVAAVEFALILPLLFMLYIGVVETTQYVAADRKSIIFARTLSDLTSQPIKQNAINEYIVDDGTLDNIFALGVATLFPFAATNAAMRVTQFAIDNNNGNPRAFVDWIETCTWQSDGTCNRAPNTNFANANEQRCDIDGTVAKDQLTPNTFLIRGEVSYHYTPIMAGLFATSVGGTDGYFNFLAKDGLQLSNSINSAPRTRQAIVREFSNGSSTSKKSDGTDNTAAKFCAPNGFKP